MCEHVYACACTHMYVQVEQDYRSLGSQVGVSLDSLCTETARAAITGAVTDAIKERGKALQKVCWVFDRMQLCGCSLLWAL